MDYNKLGKTQITNNLKIVERQYTPQQFLSSIQNKYLQTKSYEEGQIVCYNNKLFLSKVANNIGNIPNDQSQFWNELLNVNNVFSNWNENDKYNKNSFVYLDGQIYISKIDNNISNKPNQKPQCWQKYSYSTIWNKNITYQKGQFVSYSQSLYISLMDDNLNHQPVENDQYWLLFTQYGSNVDALFIQLDGQQFVSEKYSVYYDFQNYVITINHNLNGRVQGVIYDNEQKQAFFGLDYIDNNNICIQMNEDSFPNQENIWKVGLCLGVGFSVRMVNYDDTKLRYVIKDMQDQISMLKKELNAIKGGMFYIGEIDLSDYR